MQEPCLPRTKFVVAIIGLLSLVGGAVGGRYAAHAQIDNAPPPMDMASATLNRTLLGIQLENNLGTSHHSAKSHPKNLGQKATPIASTRYHPLPAVTQRVEKQYVAWFARKNPASAKQLATYFAQHNPITTWSQSVHADGLRPGDVADSFASYWILNWVIANRRDSTRAQALSVCEQVRPLIGANPAFAHLNEPQRQEMAETMMVNFVVQLTAYEQARKSNDTALLAKLGDAAVTRFRNEMGVDLRALALTDKGFRKK